MSESEYNSFARELALHTAPTLLGIKCASLVSLSKSEFDIGYLSVYFNLKTNANGLKLKILYDYGCRALLLIYNEKLLKKQLSDCAVRRVLADYGYPEDYTLIQLLDILSERLSNSDDFPHEIGIFLGYPIEDVMGFIRNNGENFKLCGMWKVYGNEEKAKKTFEKYGKCRKFLCNKLNEGTDLYQALKIS